MSGATLTLDTKGSTTTDAAKRTPLDDAIKVIEGAQGEQ